MKSIGSEFSVFKKCYQNGKKDRLRIDRRHVKQLRNRLNARLSKMLKKVYGGQRKISVQLSSSCRLHLLHWRGVTNAFG